MELLSKLIIFTQGGKGGIGKTELIIALIVWLLQKNIKPYLFDFDIENATKSSLQNFYPEAEKLDVHAEGSLDRFLDICDADEHQVIVADLGSGAGKPTFRWFDELHEDAVELGLKFTSIGVTTNDAGAVQSILKWANHLQDRTKYLIVLNELREPGSKFEYWHQEPAVKRFQDVLSPRIITMRSRIQELQAELRNHTTTLQQVIDGEVNTDYFRKTRNLVRARAYQRQLFEGFETAADILLPPSP